jgi:hypothetical protein
VRRRAAAWALAAALAAGALWAQPAAAHGLAGRADLPIPPWLFGWAATMVLIVSFVALAALWPKPRLQDPPLRPLGRFPGWPDAICGAIGVALFALVVYSGLSGTSTATENFTPTFVYVNFWVGLVIASVLFGDVFRAFNPWRATGRAAGWLARHVAGDRIPAPLPYPERLGRWPAVIGILSFAWMELAYTNKADPATLALLAIAYAVIQLVGQALYGVEPWTGRGDAFGVYFGLFARLSPLARRDGRLCWRPPLSGATTLAVVPGTIALLCVMIGTTSFDGFSSTSVWTSIAPDLQRDFQHLGFGRDASEMVVASYGLAFMVGLVAAVFWIGVRGMRTVGGGFRTSELGHRFVHTLVPIAVAYVLAHYFSLLLFQGQAIAALASDPLGHGSDLFGTATTQIDYGVVSAKTIWYVQVAALVSGHVAGLVLAHDRALAMYDQPRQATRSQYWMLVVMVGFTSLGLWLLSALNG